MKDQENTSYFLHISQGRMEVPFGMTGFPFKLTYAICSMPIMEQDIPGILYLKEDEFDDFYSFVSTLLHSSYRSTSHPSFPFIKHVI